MKLHIFLSTFYFQKMQRLDNKRKYVTPNDYTKINTIIFKNYENPNAVFLPLRLFQQENKCINT
jgi:hypothetical protein